jgi:serine/threonine protein kinase
MNTEPITNRCPKCQAPLPANAPQGLCPKCLIAAASTPTDAGQPAENTPPPPLEMVAAAFPQLEILEIIGQGGMGVVYKARQRHLDRFVALKLLPQSLATDVTFAERFNREARVLARLNHPNIVTVHDFGQSNGLFYLLMEFVDGVNLRQAMQAGRFTPQQAMMLVPKICEALQFAHDEGILHRDIKPANILLDARGRVKIADFGIAKLVGEAREKVTLTASGMAVGTPHYMAPEQLEHPQDVDQRADIYSLGVVFYEMLTGELPIGRFAPPSQKSAVDVRVDEVVFHALEREREKRFRTANEVKTSVEAITSQSAAQVGTPASPAAAPQSSAGASMPGVRVPCYFNTPARMRDCFPSAAARVFTCKGELELGVGSLSFTSTWRTKITISLKDIEDLSVGQFQMWTTPWVMKYARINYLSVSFRPQGQLQTVLLTPVEPGATSASQINDCVGRWFERVRHAASQCTGKIPHASDTASVSVSAEPAWNWKVLPLIFGCLLVGLGTWVLRVFMATGPIWFAAFLVVTLLVILLAWFAVSFLRANSALGHGDLDAVTSDDPPAPEPASAAGGRGRTPGVPRFYASSLAVQAMVVVTVLVLATLALGMRRFPASPPRALGSSGTSELTSQFVLYTMPTPLAGPTTATNHLFWEFKCLVPAQHMARILFVRWTNGVPHVEKDGSAYYEVGKASMDQDLSLACMPVPDAQFQGSTNLAPWFLRLFGKGTRTIMVPRDAAYRRLETPARLTLRSGHQLILGLVAYTTPPGERAGGKSGIELRIFLEPMKFAPVRTDPFEVQEQTYVAGIGPGWTTDQALQAIKQWPIEQ